MKKTLTKDDLKTIRDSKRIMKKVFSKMKKLEATRTWCDEHKDEDKGGELWKKATNELYSLLDELDGRIRIADGSIMIRLDIKDLLDNNI